MTLQEFKAWFEGFNENLDGEPNKKQWKRICDRVKDIDGESVTPTIIHEYVRRYRPWYDNTPYWGVSPNICSTGSVSGTAQEGVFTNSNTAMLADMGAAEAATLGEVP